MEELLAKLAEANAKTEAWIAEDPENRWAGLYILNPQHWIDRGIHNVEEFDRNELETAYYSLYKDVYGCHPSSYKSMTNEQLEAEIKDLCAENDRQIEFDKNRQKENAERFETRIASTMELIGGCDRARAIEIIADAEGILDDYKFYGNSYLEHEFDLPYGYFT